MLKKKKKENAKKNTGLADAPSLTVSTHQSLNDVSPAKGRRKTLALKDAMFKKLKSPAGGIPSSGRSSNLLNPKSQNLEIQPKSAWGVDDDSKSAGRASPAGETENLLNPHGAKKTPPPMMEETTGGPSAADKKPKKKKKLPKKDEDEENEDKVADLA